MRFANPAGLALLALAVPVLLLHMLRPRRRPVEVSSTYLWRRIPATVTAATPWQRPESTVLLWLQLLIVALLALGVARPVRLTPSPLQPHTVFILDASGSMAATDEQPSRFETAIERARSLRGRLPGRGVASLVVASSEPRVAVSAASDAGTFEEALEHAGPPGGTADFATAFSLAESLETPDAAVGFVLLSDGGLDEAQRAMLPPGTRYERVGSGRDNASVVRLTLEPRGSALHARVTLRNTGRAPQRRTMRLTVDGREAVRTAVVVPAGETIERELEIPPGDRVVARLDGGDYLRDDDSAYAIAGRRRPLKVLLAGDGNPFLERLLAAIPGVTVEKSGVSRAAPGFDLAIYDRVSVPRDPGAPFWAIAPPGGAPGITVDGSVKQPAVTLVRGDDDLLHSLDLSEVAVARAQRIRAPGDEVLAGAPGAPLLVRGTRAARPFVYLAFALADSNLPLQVAFPVLGDRLLTELAGSALPPSDLRVGESLGPPPAEEMVVRPPAGDPVVVAPGAPAPAATTPGFWTLAETGRPRRVVAANAAAGESAIAPVRSLPAPPAPERPGDRPPAGEAPLLPLLAAALAAAGLAEWILSRRRSGVSRRQWRWATGLRLAMAALVAGALLGVAVPRTGNHVATAFLIDASDSMGPGGVAAAVEWVDSALRRAPKTAESAVAFFGGDARLELTVQQSARLREHAVQVDTSRTNLAGALRLGAAVLPSDARRRIVVVSDGRITQGDAATEARRLRQEGVRVDVHPVARTRSADVAISALEVPSVVRRGERFDVQARIAATRAQSVRLTVTRNGDVVAERVLDVKAGETVVDLPQEASGTGILRWRAEVTAEADGVPENDTAFAATRVEGPARVLVAEGTPGDASALAAALVAGGVETDVRAAGTLPALDELSAYQAVVLVNVQAADLSAQQTEILAAATRDLGRGLVVVGGDRAYGLGGYLGSELEKLLPVESDIKDPKRRPPVAQVLVIDASGSMAEAVSGAATKIDIARTGAGKAIASLKENDEVGVLAFNTGQRWVLDLGPVPDEERAARALGSLQADGGTMIHEPLRLAGEALKKSKATRKHIILFSDGISGEGNLASLSAELASDGITVSAVGTGQAIEGPVMRSIAEKGKGRFYGAEDPSRIPQILTQEAVLASRNFINEGRFFPVVKSGSDVVGSLESTPPLLGYIATTPKETASKLLDISKDEDPLLATWRVGLGRSTAWTSDASERWAQAWAGWDGYPEFWTAVVKDAFPLGGVGGAAVRARIEGETLRVTVDRERPWPDGSSAEARITAPDLSSKVVRLERTAAETFAAEVPAAEAGSWAVGAVVRKGDDVIFTGTALAGRSYAEEYRPGEPNPAALESISKLSGGRGAINVAGVFDPDGLVPGRGSIPLAGLFLLLAALLWPADVALRRLALHGAGTEAVARSRRTVRRWTTATWSAATRPLRRRPEEVGPAREPDPSPPAPSPQPAEPADDTADAPRPVSTVEQLLERKRERG